MTMDNAAQRLDAEFDRLEIAWSSLEVMAIIRDLRAQDMDFSDNMILRVLLQERIADFDEVSLARLQGVLREFIPQVVAVPDPLPREGQELRSRIIGMLLESIDFIRSFDMDDLKGDRSLVAILGQLAGLNRGCLEVLADLETAKKPAMRRHQATIGEIDSSMAEIFDLFEEEPEEMPGPVQKMLKRFTSGKNYPRGSALVRMGDETELVVLASKELSLRCRGGDGGRVNLKVPGSESLLTVPGMIIRVVPKKIWNKGSFITAEILDRRIDIPALGLDPLPVDDPGGGFYEMQPVMPFGPGEDSVGFALELFEAGYDVDAVNVIHETLTEDLRCIDAHTALGNHHFEQRTFWEPALLHYQVAVQLGQWFLGPGFAGQLPWGLIENRPFLRALHGLGLCHYRAGATDEALAVFHQMMRYNPSDNQGARMLIKDIEAGRTWQEAVESES